MNVFDTTGFLYNGRKYNFTAIISWNFDDPNCSFALDNNHIDSFMYQNQFNNLFLTGSLTYTDPSGILDRILDMQYAYCEINFFEMEVKSDNDVVIEIPSATHKLYHKFYINSIDILDRQENQIKYKLNLVGSNWFKCIGLCNYTNYDKQKEDVVSIIQSILMQNGMSVNTDTFSKVCSNVKLNYITNKNDNALTSVGYLLHAMYYYRSRTDHMQCVIYNEHSDKYEMFDINNPNTWFDHFPLAITFFKNKLEQLTNAEMQNFATVTKFPKTDVHKLINDVKYYDYDISLNHITWEKIPSKTIMKYYNNYVNIGNEYIDKVVGLHESTEKVKYERYSTYWNNTNSNLLIDLYDEVTRCFFLNNSLVINTAGNITQKPGTVVDLMLDRDIKNSTGDESDDTQTLLNQYKAFEGRWFTTKVLTFLDLRLTRFTQNLILCRNFTKK